MAIDTGDPLPAFDLPTDGGGRLRTEDLKGKITVLYFYPKDDTPQCTKQAEAFRDAAAAYAEAGVTVVGVSTDGVTSHDKFKAKRSLPFALVSDAGAGLAQDLGIWVEKSMYGKNYWGVSRSTFVVDAKGVVEKVWEKVSPEGHADEVMAYLGGGAAAKTKSAVAAQALAAARAKAPKKAAATSTGAKSARKASAQPKAVKPAKVVKAAKPAKPANKKPAAKARSVLRKPAAAARKKAASANKRR